MFRFRFLFFVIFLFGCGSQEPKRDEVFHPETAKKEASSPELVDAIITADAQIEEPQGTVAPLPLEEVLTEVDQHPKVLIEVNEKVEKWIQYFTTTERESFRIFLERGETYRSNIEGILKESGVPKEFFYLAMIESGFSTRAVSPVKATGIWQFMASTGHRYGLQCNRYVDERKDPIRSTRAAAEYLKDLYNVFRSWRLAMAAYNAGEYRILRAIMLGKSRDFWTLAEKKVLPKETMNYVPKFLAAAIIGRNLKKYGFEELRPKKTFISVEAINVPSPISVKTVAAKSGISFKTLKALNPHILNGVTPPGAKFYPLWVPEGEVTLLQKVLPQLSRLRERSKRTVSSLPKYYRVKKGDKLFSIAKRYGITAKKLKQLNRLRSSTLRIGTRLVIPRSRNIYSD